MSDAELSSSAASVARVVWKGVPGVLVVVCRRARSGKERTRLTKGRASCIAEDVHSTQLRVAREKA